MAKHVGKHKVGKKRSKKSKHSVRLEPTLKHMGKHGGHKKMKRKKA